MKKLLTPFLLLFCFHFLTGQNPANVSGCSIWIKHKKKVVEDVKSKESDSLNFNSLFYLLKKDKTIISKSKLKSNFTLFVVYKSDEDKEVDILKYKIGNQELKITNKTTENSIGMEYSKVKSEKGVILGYTSNLNKVKNSNICILSFGEKINIGENTTSNDGKKTNLFEFIYYPRILNETEKLKIESYLSVKYGISLEGKKNYLSSNNSKVWNADKNEAFNSNVTGIARDDQSELFQKQSVNNKNKNLSLGFGLFNPNKNFDKNSIEDQTYLLWGDNGRKPLFKKSNGQNTNDSIVKMECIWKSQITSNSSDSIPVFLTIDTKELTNSKTEKKSKEDKVVWLAISTDGSSSFDYYNAKYFQSKLTKENELLFEGLKWDTNREGANLFTFVKAPNLFMNYQIISENCDQNENGKISCKIIGGIPPFQLKVEQNGQTAYVEKSEREFEIATPNQGIYKLVLTDKKGESFSQTLQVEKIEALEGVLNPEWHLNSSGEVEIIPSFSSNSSDEYTLTWIENDKIISNSKTLKTNEKGEYILKISNNKGCEKVFPFRVLDKHTSGQEIVLHPNPVKSGETFKIDFNLEENSKVEVKIYTINGSLVKSEKMNNSGKNFQFNSILNTSGTYLIVITTNTYSTTYKLIVD